MRLFITGATGLIGRRLVVDRLERGDHVILLSRDAARTSRLFAAGANRHVTVVQGNPVTPGPWQQAVDGCDGVIHLAAAGIADRRWTASYKRQIVSSRVDGTHQVVNAIEMSRTRPRLLILGSASGYYGNQGDRELNEKAAPGHDFLARLCVLWEAQALRAQTLGVRTVLLRTSMVLDDRGGALGKMMVPFRFLIGGPIGNGRQFMPWIHWRDLIGLIDLAIGREDLTGPVNAAAPHAVRNKEFAKLLGAVMNKPSGLPAPRLAVRVVMGELAKYVTASQRLVPAQAIGHGYSFHHPQLEGALTALLSKRPEPPTAPMETQAPALRLNAGPSPAAISGLNSAAGEIGSDQSAAPSAIIRLFAVDVDGTLLRSDGTLPQGVIQACRAAERAGCAVILASARSPRAMRPVWQALDTQSPIIAYNGAVIWNPLQDRAQYHEALSGDLARQIIDEARQLYPEVLVSIEVLDQWYTDRLDHRWFSEEERLSQPRSVGPFDGVLASPITKLNLLGDVPGIASLREMIRERYWKSRGVAVFLTDPRLLQITHPLVDKGIALQRIANRLGVRRDEVMAIGDASNDMGMIEWAGFGVAVENAYPAVKQLADAIVPSNDELGVARAIQRFVLPRRS